MTSNIFIPTYLYIKQHTTTGKLYFGKTTKKPEEYSGSGIHWLNHIKFHGKEHVQTLWYCLFLTKEDITSFALSFSHLQKIVESDEWLNLKDENGLDGNPAGTNNISKQSDETRAKMSKSHRLRNKTYKHSTEAKEKIKAYQKSRAIEPMKGKHQPLVTCPYCGKTGGASGMAIWHFNKCKSAIRPYA